MNLNISLPEGLSKDEVVKEVTEHWAPFGIDLAYVGDDEGTPTFQVRVDLMPILESQLLLSVSLVLFKLLSSKPW